MVFSSNEFLFLYLPLSLILYFALPMKWRNLALFLVSAVFYGWEKPIYLLIMLFVIVINYIFGYLIDGDIIQQNSQKSNSSEIKCVYTGYLYGGIRDAEFTLRLFSNMSDPRIHFYIF